MARKNPVIEELKEQLRKAELTAENEKELRHRTEGKLEKYEEKESEERNQVQRMMRRDEEYRQQLEDQVSWLRRLVEYLCVPADKLELINKAREEVRIEGRPYPGRNY